MINEFKQFALKGNMIDIAIGIVIGASFGTVVRSLVDDVMMPIISGIFRLPDFSNLFVIIHKSKPGIVYTSVETARDAGEAVFAYGLFINSILAFLLIAVALFFVVKTMNRLRQKQEVAVSVGPSEIDLLVQIRDSLNRK